MNEFDLDDIKKILKDCREYEPGHHMGRPFMSAYQIAIHFAQRYPNHPKVQGLNIGGTGTGAYQSLAQQIARFLSGIVKDEKNPELEGAFLSHDQLREMTFEGFDKSQVRVSTLGSMAGHSIFRVNWREDV